MLKIGVTVRSTVGR